jgi:phosphoesterase RecJ-like protein
MHNFDTLQSLLSKPKRIVITAHANPDGDALGSSLGLYHYLKQFGHRITVIMPTEIPEFLSWMKEYDQVLVYENTRLFSANIVKEADIIFALDYNSLSRTELMRDILKESTAFKVMIDHHIDPDDFCQAVLSDTSASSTCQLVYEFIEMMGAPAAFNKDILDALYVGILTDTGGFRYATSARLFKIVASMLEFGIDSNKLSDLVFNAYTIKSFNLLAYCISDCLEIMEDCNTGIIAVSQADHKKYNIQRGDLEGVVNFILKIQKIRCAVLITERREIVKLSMRSKGDFSVQEICAKYFNGGGHKNASGGSMRKPFKTVINTFKEVINSQYKAELTKDFVVDF